MNHVIVIAGPTATGKTALSVALAKELGGEIISADSVQIYEKLNIGSAKPTETERAGVPHHLMDFLPANASFSVADWCAMATEKIKEIQSRGKLPIITGGTGLYISSLVHNITFAEEKTENDVRGKLMERLEQVGKEAMHAYLRTIDPVAADAIHPNNTKRVIRAIEIFETTGKTMTEQNKASKETPSPFDFTLCALTCAREKLYERIDRRVEIMVEQGLFSEVRSLLSEGLLETAQSMQGIGYKEVVQHFRGELSAEEAIALIQKNSRNYAKRQLTWFKRENYQWFDCLSAELYDRVRTYIGEKIHA